MEKDINEITGEVQNIRDKAVAIENVWYNSFAKIKDIKKGDIVKIQYTKKESNNRIFNNIKNIEKVKNETNKITIESLDKIDTTTLNTLIMTIKELYINKNDSIENITNEVIEMYKQIKKQLN